MLLLHGGSSGPCGQESVQGCMGAKEEAGSMYFLGCYHPLSIYAWLLTHSHSQTLCWELRKESKGGNQEFKVLTSHRAGRGCLQKFFLLIQLFRELSHICDPHWIEWQRFSKSPRQLSHEDGGANLSSEKPSWMLHKSYILKPCGIKSSNILTRLDWR